MAAHGEEREPASFEIARKFGKGSSGRQFTRSRLPESTIGSEVGGIPPGEALGPSDAEDEVPDADWVLPSSPTALRRNATCPLQYWLSQRFPSETSAPSLAMAVGEIEHAARAELSKALRVLLTGATKYQDLESGPFGLLAAGHVAELFEAHGYVSAFGAFALDAEREVSRLLAVEAFSRLGTARRAFKRGLRGEALANAASPFSVEARMCDPDLRIRGVADELWYRSGLWEVVELKTSPPLRALRLGNRVQAATYAFLLERTSSRRVRRFAVRYTHTGLTDWVDYTNEWRRRIPILVHRARLVSLSETPPKARPSRGACEYCPFQRTCPSSLAPSAEAGISSSLDAMILRIGDGK